MPARSTVPAHAGPGPRELLFPLKDQLQPLQGNARTRPRWKDFGPAGLTVLAPLLQQVGQGPRGEGTAWRFQVLAALHGWVTRVPSASLCCVPEATVVGPGGDPQPHDRDLGCRSSSHRLLPHLQRREWLSHGPAGAAPAPCSGFLKSLDAQLGSSFCSFACG